MPEHPTTSVLNPDFDETIYYNGTLSSADRESTECYLGVRYSMRVPHTCD
jgi:hypothetical protein